MAKSSRQDDQDFLLWIRARLCVSKFVVELLRDFLLLPTMSLQATNRVSVRTINVCTGLQGLLACSGSLRSKTAAIQLRSKVEGM